MASEVRLIDMNTLWQCDTCFHHGTNGCKTWCDYGEAYRPAADKFKIIDPESLRQKGHWDIRCESHIDSITREVDENFYLECSECKRKVWDINQMAAMNGEYRKLIEEYPYCHCGAKMEG